MRSYLFLAAVFGITAVALGAFGAHALKDTLLAHSSAANWQTAVIYHLVHSVALLAIGLFLSTKTTENAAISPWFGRAAICWTVGITMFSGSLYALSLGAPIRFLWPVTPLGGLALIAGWACLLLTSRKKS